MSSLSYRTVWLHLQEQWEKPHHTRVIVDAIRILFSSWQLHTIDKMKAKELTWGCNKVILNKCKLYWNKKHHRHLEAIIRNVSSISTQSELWAVQSVSSATHPSAEPSMLVCLGRLQQVKKKGFLKATYHPLGGRGTPSLLPFLIQEFPNSLSHWNSRWHLLWCRWAPATQPGKVFPRRRTTPRR